MVRLWGETLITSCTGQTSWLESRSFGRESTRITLFVTSVLRINTCNLTYWYLNWFSGQLIWLLYFFKTSNWGQTEGIACQIIFSWVLYENIAFFTYENHNNTRWKQLGIDNVNHSKVAYPHKIAWTSVRCENMWQSAALLANISNIVT